MPWRIYEAFGRRNVSQSPSLLALYEVGGQAVIGDRGKPGFNPFAPLVSQCCQATLIIEWPDSRDGIDICSACKRKCRSQRKQVEEDKQ